MAANILDGLTFDSRFPGQGWDPPFNFKWRPALNARVVEYRAAIKDAPAKVITQRQHEFLREFLVSWDRVDKNGAPLSLTDPMAYEILSDAAVSFMWSEIAGYGADTYKMIAPNSPSPSA